MLVDIRYKYTNPSKSVIKYNVKRIPFTIVTKNIKH